MPLYSSLQLYILVNYSNASERKEEWSINLLRELDEKVRCMFWHECLLLVLVKVFTQLQWQKKEGMKCDWVWLQLLSCSIAVMDAIASSILVLYIQTIQTPDSNCSVITGWSQHVWVSWIPRHTVNSSRMTW